ncbi:amidohydrolase family protein [Sphingomonas colocasiae]|uniref:Amidohydrolase family protein n=1 Tax=Sphingomonas colocasiae TaxID=1848973 RepID=A0ABS7PU91_9SPHN|nr:amidohydrolase family protein [Sphingomonas colocasiae]MBY8823559.1 amidohydrolase family protein [Sphingomonas colocasiae]
MPIRRSALTLMFAAVAAFAPMTMAMAADGDLIIRNARIVDARGEQGGGLATIRIVNGRIAAIEKQARKVSGKARGTTTIDADGGHVAPGLVDAHVHMMWSPGCALQHPDARTENWKQTCGRLLPDYLRAYLASGVTTIVDFAGPGFVHKAIRKLEADGAPSPRYEYLSPVLATAGGYGGVPPFADPDFMLVASEADVDRAFGSAREAGVIGVKVLLESGFIDFQKMPTHSAGILARIGTEAKKNNLPVFIHASSEADMNRALDIAPRGLAHTLINRDTPLSQAFIDRMAKSGTFQVSTLQTTDSYLNRHEPRRLSRPGLEVVPPSELAYARDPRNGDRAVSLLSGNPDDPVAVEQTAAALSPNSVNRTLKVSEGAIRALARAGVPIVTGSDTPHHPFALYSFHGPSSIREMELLGEAGLSPMEVLTASTLTPARMFGIDRDQGTVEIGKIADLVILNGNPARDIGSWHKIKWVVRAGRAATPARWLKFRDTAR